MKRAPRRRASAPSRPHNAHVERDEHTQPAGHAFSSRKRQTLCVRLLKSIFGVEKIERLLSAMHFSYGDTVPHHVAGNRLRVRRFGLLLVLLFLQSLFVAIDYLPVTLEVLSRSRACTYTPATHNEPTEQSDR